MGKMTRLGWKFVFGEHGQQMDAVEPGGAHTFTVDLGPDDTLRLPHGIRACAGADSTQLPVILAAVNTLRRTAIDASYLFLHAIFNHRGDEKLYQTLLHTLGYKAQSQRFWAQARHSECRS